MLKYVNSSYKTVDFSYSSGSINVYNEMQFHSFCELYFFINGKAEFINNHIKQTVLPNQLVIIPAGVYHRFNVLGEIDKYKRCVLNIHPDFIDSAILQEAIREKEILTFSSSDRIVKHFHYLIDCMNKIDKKDFEAILSAVATDIIYIIKYSENNQKQYSSSLRPFAQELMTYIDSHFTEDITLEFLAGKFNYSVSHISHAFKEEFGISIIKYILQKRLNSAHLEILQGGKVQEVSQYYGFSNYSTFFRLYKKNFGVSPSKFKNRQK